MSTSPAGPQHKNCHAATQNYFFIITSIKLLSLICQLLYSHRLRHLYTLYIYNTAVGTRRSINLFFLNVFVCMSNALHSSIGQNIKSHSLRVRYPLSGLRYPVYGVRSPCQSVKNFKWP